MLVMILFLSNSSVYSPAALCTSQVETLLSSWTYLDLEVSIVAQIQMILIHAILSR